MRGPGGRASTLLSVGAVAFAAVGCGGATGSLSSSTAESTGDRQTSATDTIAPPDDSPSFDCGPTGSFTTRQLPNFCGQPYDEAYAYVAANAAIGMQLDMKSNGAGQDDYNIVCSQRPRAGAAVKPGMTLVLEVGDC